MSPMLVILTRAAEGFPRVSGDEPDWIIPTILFPTFSPRERG